MRALQLILLFVHGLIHLMGFSKAFGLAAINQLTQSISKIHGVFWFIAAVLFIGTAVIFFFHLEWWWMIGGGAILISQYLIIVSWQDAKFGTIGNVFIFISVIIGFATWSFGRQYRTEVEENLLSNSSTESGILTEEEIQNLPKLVQQYLHYTGAVGKPKVTNFKVEFTGQLRQMGEGNWMPFTSQQYNFIQPPARLFYLKAVMKHLPVTGFHCYKNGSASMDIRLFSLFNVQYQDGRAMDIAETVTFFNDMCVLAPATLIDDRIKWVSEEKNMVKAEFTNGDITISTELYFSDSGALINFISPDRYAVIEDGTMKKNQWSTPLGEYKDFNGRRLPTKAEAVYGLANGDFTYGKFTLKTVTYNVRDYEYE